ncbi:MAG: DUF3823 domain-containing protein [Chitinophaga sp.]|uniref:DUF3823 domain-containing protein n=1 Tax=Chitinophaga sp. TaxID=1869181 RepID=UPI001B2D2389|nr:DUF3823 domain-containing protein [Chitinophaga sp.]MBO9727409.1 DUF3823 domain-containing protein [Chitinophaga sp.]
MRTKLQYVIIMVAGILAASCKKDNYKAPSSQFSGRLVYQGETINVSYNDVYFELWEPGWGKSIPINVSISQDGKFSALLFNASYKLVIPAAQGPFRSIPDKTTNSDTIPLTISGNLTRDIEVLPYYMIRSPKFVTAGNTVTATFAAEKIIKDVNARDIERVSLYVCKTQFVDGRNSVATKDLAGGNIADPAAISLQADVPALVPAQKTVFARVGIKVAGIEDMIYSPVQEISL